MHPMTDNGRHTARRGREDERQSGRVLANAERNSMYSIPSETGYPRALGQSNGSHPPRYVAPHYTAGPSYAPNTLNFSSYHDITTTTIHPPFPPPPTITRHRASDPLAPRVSLIPLPEVYPTASIPHIKSISLRGLSLDLSLSWASFSSVNRSLPRRHFEDVITRLRLGGRSVRVHIESEALLTGNHGLMSCEVPFSAPSSFTCADLLGSVWEALRRPSSTPSRQGHVCAQERERRDGGREGYSCLLVDELWGYTQPDRLDIVRGANGAVIITLKLTKSPQ